MGSGSKPEAGGGCTGHSNDFTGHDSRLPQLACRLPAPATSLFLPSGPILGWPDLEADSEAIAGVNACHCRAPQSM